MLADGAVLSGHASDKCEVIQLIAEEFPFVYAGRRESPENNISYAAADYTGATEQIVEYLFDHLHKRIAYLAAQVETKANRDRHASYVRAHRHFPATDLSL